jgi:hypothetical protein
LIIVVVAGGGGGGYNSGGGGGAGGLREYSIYSRCLLSATTYPITVGGGGAGGCVTPPKYQGNLVQIQYFQRITLLEVEVVGGGNNRSRSGGSGGGSGAICTPDAGGVGNTPPVSPPQGNPGGAYNICGYSCQGSTGGGGATTAGGPKGQGDGAQEQHGGNGKDVSQIHPGSNSLCWRWWWSVF